MKKSVFVFAILGLIIILVGCALTEDNKANNTPSEMGPVLIRDVVFMNILQGDTYTSGIKRYYDVRTELQLANEYDYEYDEQENADTLYAFTVSLIEPVKGTDYKKTADYPVREQDETEGEYDKRLTEYKNSKLKEIMKSEGILIVSDYSVNDLEPLECVIACTMNDLVRVFDNEDGEINKWHYYVDYTIRPDMEQILRDTGWSEEIERVSSDWYKHNKELVQAKTGTDIQVIFSVEIE